MRTSSWVFLVVGLVAACSAQQKSSTFVETSNASCQRFVFPAKAAPFPDSSVALDTKTGQLCKTYDWKDSPDVPRGLARCSAALGSNKENARGGKADGQSPVVDRLVEKYSKSDQSAPMFLGATKVFHGYTYVFDGTHWKRKSEARVYNPSTGKLEPNNEDPYDPLGLFTKEEKAKRLLTQEQILRVTKEFGVSYEEAWQDAKSQGYQVPRPYTKDNPFVSH